MVKIGQVFEFDYYGESDGYVMVHAHFKCPICKGKDVATDYVAEYNPSDPDHIGETFYCGECRAEFEFVGDKQIKYITLGKI